jgi:hypothetical protein
MPDVVAADVLLHLARINETVQATSALIEGASELPGILARHRKPPRTADFEKGDWHVEPLLPTKQVAELLGVSTRRVRALPIRSIDVGGDVRYRRAELRRFLTSQERTEVNRFRGR